MASTNNYINEYETLEEMNAAYESDHSGSWVAYCAEDNNLYYQQKTSISSKYFDNLGYNSENKTLDFYIDGEVKKSIDVSPWWFEKDSYYTREESDSKYINNIGTSGNNLTYTINTTTTSLTIPYASSTPWKGVTNTPTTLNGYGIKDIKFVERGVVAVTDAWNFGQVRYTDNKTSFKIIKMSIGDFEPVYEEIWFYANWHSGIYPRILKSSRGTNTGMFLFHRTDGSNSIYDLYCDIISNEVCWIYAEGGRSNVTLFNGTSTTKSSLDSDFITEVDTML